jgi:hypothetical protein
VTDDDDHEPVTKNIREPKLQNTYFDIAKPATVQGAQPMALPFARNTRHGTRQVA